MPGTDFQIPLPIHRTTIRRMRFPNPTITKFIGFAMTDGSNTAPTMGAPLSFSTNSAGNVVLHMKNRNGLIRATFMYFITQDYLGSGGITIQVMSLKFRDVDTSGTVTDRTGNTELLCYLVILQ